MWRRGWTVDEAVVVASAGMDCPFMFDISDESKKPRDCIA